MASGRTHARVAAVLQVPLTIAGAVLFLSGDSDLGVGLVIGGFLGLLITPDIDHHARTVEEVRFYQLGKVPGVVWEWLWYGYALFVPHRGLSHWPVIGTLSRMLYLAVLLRVASWLLAGFTGDVCHFADCEGVTVPLGAMALLLSYQSLWAGVLLGWIMQDLGHLLLDR